MLNARFILRLLIFSTSLSLLLNVSTASADSPSLKISGAFKKEEKNIRALIRPDSMECKPPTWRYPQLKKRILSNTKKALRSQGYYHPEIELNLNPAQDCIEITLEVNQGVGVMVQVVTIIVQGGLQDSKEFSDFIYELPLSEGQLLEHNKYEDTRIGIEQLAARLGYFDGEFTIRQLDVNTDTNDAYITLIYQSGPRYKLGEITIKQGTFSDELIDQFTILKSGEYYDSKRLIDQQQALNDSTLFSQVDVIAQRNKRNNLIVPVSITLEARKRTAHRFGIGASTDLGPRISYKLDRRWINSRGHSGSIAFALSPSTRKVTTNYSIPMGDQGQTRFDFQTGYLQEITDSSESESYKLAANKTQLRDKNWTRTYSLEFLRENFTTGDTTDTTDLLMPGVRWNKIRADNSLFPRDGWHLQVRLRSALEGLLADTDLAQIRLGFKAIQPLHTGRVIARITTGATYVTNFDVLPSSLRFYAGGDGSIRGFNYKSLGPKDDDGETIGGKYLGVGSIEYEHPVTEKTGLAVFMDSGNAFDEIDQFRSYTSYGVGYRWHSPLGPIRIDLAQDIENKEGFRFHLSMGPDL